MDFTGFTNICTCDLVSISSFFVSGKQEVVMFLRKRTPLIEDDPETSRASEAPAVTFNCLETISGCGDLIIEPQ